jgi:hypothetical protein
VFGSQPLIGGVEEVGAKKTGSNGMLSTATITQLGGNQKLGEFTDLIADTFANARANGSRSWDLVVSYTGRFGEQVSVHVRGVADNIVMAFDSSCSAAREMLAKTARRAATALEEATRKKVRLKVPGRSQDQMNEEHSQ